MLTDCRPTCRRLSRFARRACGALALLVMGSALTAPAQAAGNLVNNGTFAITGGTSSFWWAGYSYWGGSESLGGWSFTSAGANNIGAAFDFANGATSACYGGSSGCSTTSGTYQNIEQVLPTAITAPTGGNFLAVAANWTGATQSSGVSQSISGLTAGATYILSFSYAATQWYNYTGSDQVAWTATLGTSQSTPTLSIPAQGFSNWATATFTYVATAATETLTLLATSGSGQPPLALLANVSLTKAPEPMSVAVLGTGVLAVMCAARRRRAPASTK